MCEGIHWQGKNGEMFSSCMKGSQRQFKKVEKLKK